MMSFAQKPWEQMTGHFNAYRQQFQQIPQPRRPGAGLRRLPVLPRERGSRPRLLAREHMSNYYLTVMEHYDMAGDHFKKMKGYGDYADQRRTPQGHRPAGRGERIHRYQYLGHAEADPREARSSVAERSARST
jgi:hypothetical protein